MDIGVSAIVFNKDRTKVLVQKREDLKIWTIPGGAVEPNESPTEAVIRETKEETGVEVEPIRISGIYLRDIRFLEALNITFVCKPIKGKLTTSSENVDVAWMPINKALKMTVGRSAQKIKDALSEENKVFLRINKDLGNLPRRMLLKWFLIQIKRKIKKFLNQCLPEKNFCAFPKT